MRRIAAAAVALVLCAAPVAAQAPQKIIFDTDFAFPPQDDAMALFFVLNSPELEILGITTVAGNRSRNVATADALKVLEVTGRTDIPLFEGAAAPLRPRGHRVGHQAPRRLVRQRAGPGAAGRLREAEARRTQRDRLPGRDRDARTPGRSRSSRSGR